MGTEALSAVFPIFSGWPTSEWPANAVVWGDYTLDTQAVSVAGAYPVILTPISVETGSSYGQPVAVGQVNIPSERCMFPALPENAIDTAALFGDVMWLLGYQFSHRANELDLTLYWRSVYRMDTDFKIFVHVFDPVTSIPVAQNDAMPMQWQYPTTFWDPGEIVVDTVSISLEGVLPGNYGVAVGIYDPTNMERLSVLDRAGQFQADDRLVLQGHQVRIEGSMP